MFKNQTMCVKLFASRSGVYECAEKYACKHNGWYAYYYFPSMMNRDDVYVNE